MRPRAFPTSVPRGSPIRSTGPSEGTKPPTIRVRPGDGPVANTLALFSQPTIVQRMVAAGPGSNGTAPHGRFARKSCDRIENGLEALPEEVPMKLTIATCQFPVSSDIPENLRSVLRQAVAPDAAHGGDALSGRATTDAEGDPAAGQHAERGGRLGEDGRWPQVQQVRDVGKERDAVGFGSQVSDERPDVEELRIASVVL
jgi:hypothetical protein